VTMLAAGRLDDDAATSVPDGFLYAFDDRLLFEAGVGDPDAARRMAAEYFARPDADGFSTMVAAAAVGDRETANANAAAIDARAGGPFLLALGTEMCFCGAPFDLDATPNFKARLKESGFPWPPRTPIAYPLKTW